MKRKIVTAMAAVFVCAAVMTGCGSKAADNSSDKSSQTEEAKDPGTSKQADAGSEISDVDNSLVEEPEAVADMPADGEYTADVSLEGGTGKATVESPAKITIKEGIAYATIVWSSKNYDYMIVDDEKYMNENNGGSSTFTFPLPSLPCEINVVGDTTAMSTPHEIDYTLTFSQINE